MENIFISAVITAISLIVVILLTAFISKRSNVLCEAPGLDVVVALLTFVPWIFMNIVFGWKGVIGALIGQLLVLSLFNTIHGFLNKGTTNIIKNTLNKIVGPFRNHIGLLISLLAIPILWAVRISQIIIWPLLVWTLDFPRYKSSEWINVSRHKIKGLVGHDLVWCLYCDWMTGIYSYGGEMLRNVESFWCPIKFYSDKKCENCKIDFPDIEKWVGSGNYEDVKSLLLSKYPPDSKLKRSWFGYKLRNKN